MRGGESVKLIFKPRQSGKTSELIRMSEETNAYILTPNRMMAQHISKMAEEQGHNILFPVTLDEYLNSRFKGSHVRHILIDDADMILQQIFNEVTIDAITMSEREPTVQAVPIEEVLKIIEVEEKWLYQTRMSIRDIDIAFNAMKSKIKQIYFIRF